METRHSAEPAPTPTQKMMRFIFGALFFAAGIWLIATGQFETIPALRGLAFGMLLAVSYELTRYRWFFAEVPPLWLRILFLLTGAALVFTPDSGGIFTIVAGALIVQAARYAYGYLKDKK